MSQPLIVFAACVLLMLAALGYFLRGALFSISTQAAAHAKTYAVAYVKGGALITLAMLAAFDESFRTLTREAALALPWWGWALLFFKPIAAGLAVLVAFLDRSTQRAEQIKTGNTIPPFTPPPPSP